MAKPDFYAVLGVRRDADAGEIKQAYRRLALESHPDRYPGDAAAEERFRQIAEAYSTLGDSENRRRYDRGLLFPESIDLANPPTIPSPRDLFDSVFGDLLGQKKRKRRRGRDIRYTLSVDLEQAVLGSTHKISFDALGPCGECSASGTQAKGRQPEECSNCFGRGEVKNGGVFSRRSVCGRCDGTGMVQLDPCRSCGGRGSRSELREFSVRLAPGTAAGAERVLRGQGEPGRYGGEPGNLRVTVNVRPHAWLRREDDDLHSDVFISLADAIVGNKIPVASIDGPLEMKLPSGVQSGTKMRLRGKGVPLAKGGRGDQIVLIRIETPTDLNPMQIEELIAWEQGLDRSAMPKRSEMHREFASSVDGSGEGSTESENKRSVS